MLFALLAVMLFFRLGSAPIYILDEAKNAQCAREMLQRNDWVVPTFNGELRTDKPVLHYYFMMLAYKTFGVTEYAARFFSVIAGLMTVLLTFFFTRRYINGVAAFCAALVLAASPHFIFEFRLSVPDPYLIVFICGGLFGAYRYLEDGKLGVLLLATASFAFATLAKGPVALALPGLCLLIWIVNKKKWNRLFSWKMLPALVVLTALILPWYIAVHKATNGAWTKGFFIDHNLNRFSDPQEGHGGFFLLPVIFVVIGLLPFVVYSGEAIKSRKAVFGNDLVKFSGIVVLAFVVFFSIASTKLPNYPMPCYPFAAIILGHYLSLLVHSQERKKYPLYILMAVTFIIPIAGFFAIKQEVEAANLNWIALFLLLGFLALLVVSILWKNLENYTGFIAIGLSFSIFNSMFLHFIYPTLYKQNPVAKTIRVVERQPVIFAYHIYNPGYNFYLKGPVIVFDTVDSLSVALKQNPGAILITRKQKAGDLKALSLIKVAEHHDLFELPTTVLYVPK